MTKSEDNLLRRAHQDTIRSLARGMDFRCAMTGRHQYRAAALAFRISRRLGLDRRSVLACYAGGLVHDIGKFAVPTSILGSAEKLTERQFSKVREHPTVGRAILADVGFNWPIAEIVHQHHERLDGSGYPRGLSGDEIMAEARVVAVADVAEAFLSHRPYMTDSGLGALGDHFSGTGAAIYCRDATSACMEILSS